MFISIFKRRGTTDKSKRQERGFTAAPASGSKRAASQADTAAQLDIVVDEAMVTLSRELLDLARLEVGQAAMERGWATLRRELQHRPVRAAAPVMAKGTGAKGAVRVGAGPQARTAHSGGRLWILGSAVTATVAVIVTLAVIYGGGGGGQTVVSNPASTSTVTSVATSDSSVPNTTIRADETTVPTSDTTQGPVTTGNTPNTSQGPSTTGGTTDTTRSTTGTSEQQMAAAQFEKDAKAVALDLGTEVVDVYFRTGDLSGAYRLMTSEAQANLSQMIQRLTDPSGFRQIGTKLVSTNKVRVTLEITDRVPDGQGGVDEVTKRFVLDIRVNESGAKITAISYAGS